MFNVVDEQEFHNWLIMSEQWHTITVCISFASNQHASIAKRTIEVDAELQSQAVKRTLTVNDEDLTATFETLTVRLARLAVNAFLENVDLIAKTLGSFGDEAKRQP
jgi:EKC/KEOPS complex subunit PCC1/LAGE3